MVNMLFEKAANICLFLKIQNSKPNQTNCVCVEEFSKLHCTYILLDKIIMGRFLQCMFLLTSKTEHSYFSDLSFFVSIKNTSHETLNISNFTFQKGQFGHSGIEYTCKYIYWLCT